MSYDAFATTFSNSRKNLHWPELEYIIADMKQRGCTSVLDVGCGNGRFLDWFGKSPSVRGVEHGNPQIETFRYLGIDSSEGMIREAHKLHPDHQFEVIGMQELGNSSQFSVLSSQFNCLLFLASFHHLSTREERMQVLQDSKKLLTPNGCIYMTNWNLRDQERYEASHRGDGEYDIKIGEFSRYYHGFTQGELAALFIETGYQVVENRIFDGGRNFLSIISL